MLHPNGIQKAVEQGDPSQNCFILVNLKIGGDPTQLDKREPAADSILDSEIVKT